jgi:hypothetical protein
LRLNASDECPDVDKRSRTRAVLIARCMLLRKCQLEDFCGALDIMRLQRRYR